MLGSHTFRVLAVILLVIAVVLQTGATTATKAIKFSAKLVTGKGPAPAGADAPQPATATAGPPVSQTAPSNPSAAATESL